MLDVDGDGDVSPDELQRGLESAIGIVLEAREIEVLFDTIDEDGGGLVSYAELASALAKHRGDFVLHDFLDEVLDALREQKKTIPDLVRTLSKEQPLTYAQFQMVLATHWGVCLSRKEDRPKLRRALKCGDDDVLDAADFALLLGRRSAVVSKANGSDDVEGAIDLAVGCEDGRLYELTVRTAPDSAEDFVGAVQMCVWGAGSYAPK